MENNAQYRATLDLMVLWLSHPCELGRKPKHIEGADIFTFNGLTYYVVKFKPDEDGDWLMGVAGGFAPESTEPCGYVFSRYQVYDEKTAVDDGMAMIGDIIAYWKARAGVNIDPK